MSDWVGNISDAVVDKDPSELREEDDIECTADDDDCFDESLNLDEISNSETDVCEYESCELKNNVAFSQFKWTSCLPHTLAGCEKLWAVNNFEDIAETF